jgi:hypothetical protein
VPKFVNDSVEREKGVSVMPFKAIAFLLVVGLSVLLFVAMRKDNRADAAAGNCYASAQGPSSPTICQ